ncbi:dihydrofolate reductase-like domain-containing protein [Amylostereum chailletii]|nr:dihydrofolate reductase-like domain-containing protein [Amylostereum chailletii]
MASESPSNAGPPPFLASLLGSLSSDAQPGTSPIPALVSPDPKRPYVTLTFAQSLDAKIAGRGGKQLILSGDESMRMTHWMRTMYDGILIGVGTAVNDNPQLNVRHLPFPTQNNHFKHYHHPQPLILDPRLRLSPKCKLLNNAKLGAGVAPWVISVRPSDAEEGDKLQEWEARKAVLENAGAKVILVEQDPSYTGSSYLPMRAVLEAIRAEGIRSVMVEVTVAPVIVGGHGVGYSEHLDNVPGLTHVKTEVFGKDTVIGMKAEA